jgi:hypothetical protein
VRYWWLSFADARRPKGSQFLGAVLLQAYDVTGAIRAAWRLGINPGGEVLAHPAPFTFRPRDGWAERLLSAAECAEFDRVHGRPES